MINNQRQIDGTVLSKFTPELHVATHFFTLGEDSYSMSYNLDTGDWGVNKAASPSREILPQPRIFEYGKAQ